MGQSTPLANLWVIPPWEDCLMDCMDAVVLTRALTGCRNVGMGTSQNSTQGKAKSCTWGATASIQRWELEALWLEAALQKGPLGSRVCIWQRKPTAT